MEGTMPLFATVAAAPLAMLHAVAAPSPPLRMEGTATPLATSPLAVATAAAAPLAMPRADAAATAAPLPRSCYFLPPGLRVARATAASASCLRSSARDAAFLEAAAVARAAFCARANAAMLLAVQRDMLAIHALLDARDAATLATVAPTSATAPTAAVQPSAAPLATDAPTSATAPTAAVQPFAAMLPAVALPSATLRRDAAFCHGTRRAAARLLAAVAPTATPSVAAVLEPRPGGRFPMTEPGGNVETVQPALFDFEMWRLVEPNTSESGGNV
jgi:hypothetical protein